MNKPNVVKIHPNYKTLISSYGSLTMKRLADDQVLKETEGVGVVVLDCVTEHSVNADNTKFIVVVVWNDTHRGGTMSGLCTCPPRDPAFKKIPCILAGLDYVSEHKSTITAIKSG